jgi:uncharacterized protein YecT (DUF1311 family)
MTIEKDAFLLKTPQSPVSLILFGAFLIFMNAAKGQEKLEVGNSCTAKNKLPQAFVCADGFVVDCDNSNPREQLYCTAGALQKADKELNRLYQRALKTLEKKNDESADYRAARKALLEGQRAWMRFKKSDCEVPGYLNLKGSIQSNEVVDCELKRTKNRIADLHAYFTP